MKKSEKKKAEKKMEKKLAKKAIKKEEKKKEKGKKDSKKGKISKKLVEYVESNILPRYDSDKIDTAHKRSHVETVIKNALDIVEDLGVKANLDMIYTIAAYHDIGLLKGRKYHHTYSKVYVLKDRFLKKFFDQDQLMIIADAVEDHRSSNEFEPRSIYGKIVSDADRCVEQAMVRALRYNKGNYEDAIKHVLKKYNKDMKFRIIEGRAVEKRIEKLHYNVGKLELVLQTEEYKPI